MRVELAWPLPARPQTRPPQGGMPTPASPSAPVPAPAARPVVLDTNIVLDLLVFADPATALLRQLLQAGALQWIATAAMRGELERVLAYDHIAPRVVFYGLSAPGVLAAFDAQARCVPVAARLPTVVCRDTDDQPFLDLAAAHGAVLLSKDRAVLALRKRLRNFGADVGTVLVQVLPEAGVAAPVM